MRRLWGWLWVTILNCYHTMALFMTMMLLISLNHTVAESTWKGRLLLIDFLTKCKLLSQQIFSFWWPNWILIKLQNFWLELSDTNTVVSNRLNINFVKLLAKNLWKERPCLLKIREYVLRQWIIISIFSLIWTLYWGRKPPNSFQIERILT